jgi:hypothetical protein
MSEKQKVSFAELEANPNFDRRPLVFKDFNW